MVNLLIPILASAAVVGAGIFVGSGFHRQLRRPRTRRNGEDRTWYDHRFLLKWFVFFVGGIVAYVLGGYVGVIAVAGIVAAKFAIDNERHRRALAAKRR
jgi:hypothetical protein